MTITALPALNRASATFKTDADTYFETLLPAFSTAVANGMREKLSAARTIYVSTTGTDNASWGDVGNPLLTLQYAIDMACSYDLGLYDLTIQVGAGTWTQGVTLRKYVTGGGRIIIRGDTTTPANCLMSCTSVSCFEADGQMEYLIEGFKLQTTTSGFGVVASSMSKIIFGNMVFGACANDQIYIVSGSVVVFAANYSITGGAPSHWRSDIGGIMQAQSKTITLTGTPAFTTFAKADNGAILALQSNTYSGSATGQKYLSENNAVINSGVTLPGSTAGAAVTGRYA
ncbi:MAG: hypothetical protein WC829_09835 [Hyphomicrobium sp.]|jgi:hypothetical protein